MYTKTTLLLGLFALSAKAATIQVAVGSQGLVFTPMSVVAQAGDVVQFTVASGHIVAQSTDFNDPCSNLQGALHSSSNAQFNVTDTTPTWWHCDVPGHCQAGMVFAINPPTSGDQTIQNYQSLAEGKAVSSSGSAASSATSAASSAAESASAAGAASSSTSAPASATSSAAPSATTSGSAFAQMDLPRLLALVAGLIGTTALF